MSLLNVGAFSGTDFCTELKSLLVIVGWVLTILKFVIPLLIIALGAFDFGKAVVAEKEDEIKKQAKRLVYRVVAGVLIFLLPTIILFVFKVFAPDYENGSQDFKTCEDCILRPNTCK